MFRILNKLQQGNKHSSKIYGEVAQLARARGSYPRCRGFKSPPRYLNEEIRNVGCPAFLIFFVFGKYENTCREDFLLDEREGSVLWLVKRYTKHAAGQATGRKKW